MNSDKIKEFYDKLSKTDELKHELAKFNFKNKEELSHEKIKKIIKEVILPLSKKLGYNFSQEDLLSFEKMRTSSSKEKLTSKELESVSGGMNLWALLLALSFTPPFSIASGTPNAITRENSNSVGHNGVPIPSFYGNENLNEQQNDITQLNPTDIYGKKTSSEQSLTKESTKSSDISDNVISSNQEEKQNLLQDTKSQGFSRDDFLKILDGSTEVNSTAVFLHDTMEKNSTWLLSEKMIEQAAKSDSNGAQKNIPKEIQDGLNLLEDTLPTDPKGLKNYLKIEVDKFKDYKDEFLKKYNAASLKEAAIEFCKSNYSVQYNKESRNISREALIRAKKTVLFTLNESHPEILRASSGLGKNLSSQEIENDLSKQNSIEEKEKYLDKKLKIFKEKLKDYDLAKVVHNFIAEKIAYNYADIGVERCEGLFRNNAEQVLENGWGLCYGYAQLTELLMRVVGVPCTSIVSNTHAFNAIFINNNWFLIDTTWDAYKVVNKPLTSRFARFKNIFFRNSNYNVVHNEYPYKGRQNYFPKTNDLAEDYNEKFMSDSEHHVAIGATLRLNNGQCEITYGLSTDGDKNIWDVTKECLVDGELKLPNEIAERTKWLVIDDDKILNEIKRLHIPKHILLNYELEEHLHKLDNVTVEEGNPYYGGSEGIVWDKKSNEILWINPNEVHISKDVPLIENPKNYLENVKKVTVEDGNPNYGGSQGIVWDKESNEILWVNPNEIHISKDVPLIEDLKNYLENVKKVTVEEGNPNYGGSQGIVWDKSSTEILWINQNKVHISKDVPFILNLIVYLNKVKEVTVAKDNPYYGGSQGIVWDKDMKLIFWFNPNEVHISKDVPPLKNLDSVLKIVKKVTVEKDNPYYIMYKPKFFGKEGLYTRMSVLNPLAEPLWEPKK